MEIFGWRVPQVAVPVAHFVKHNPVVAALGGSACLMLAIQQNNQRKTRNIVLQTEQRIADEIHATVDDVRATLRTLDQSWNKDIKAKDELLKTLQMQNIAQTRSVNRLQAALQTCKPTVMRGDEVHHQMTLIAQQLQQQQQQQQVAAAPTMPVIPAVEALPAPPSDAQAPPTETSE